jgi:hypothetical protein
MLPSLLKSPVTRAIGVAPNGKLELLCTLTVGIGEVTGRCTTFEISPDGFVTVTPNVPSIVVTGDEEKKANICVPEEFTVVDVDWTEPTPGPTSVTTAF